MPRLSCWFIKTSLLHLAIGVGMGGLILSAKAYPAPLSWSWQLLPAHIQLLIGGWLIQLALGMAYWILPRLNSAGNRGRSGWAWTSFAALNSGVIGAATLLTLRPHVVAPWLDVLHVLAALLQTLALGSFAVHAWPRLRQITPPVQPIQRDASRQTRRYT